MGNKKPRRKTSPKAPPSADLADGGVVAGDVANELDVRLRLMSGNGNVGNGVGDKIEYEFESPLYSNIKMECEKAMNSLRRANHTKALRLIKEASHKFKNSALIHRVQATICVKAAAVVDDGGVKQRHLRNGLESARRAVELSPYSIEYASFYANLMFEMSSESKEYEEVMHECEKALGIENPIDPAKESLHDESQHKLTSADVRIGSIREDLRSLIQKANLSSITNWMRVLGHEDKITIVPFKKVLEDPMEAKLLEPRRVNEIKKANKTPEERRKEIEVRVAAARLLQQKPESPPSSVEKAGLRTRRDFSSDNAYRSGEMRRNRNARKNGFSLERRERVRSYWSAMSMEKKLELLRVRVYDLKAHFSALKDTLPYELLSEALAFAEANKTWKFWICCACRERFADLDAHMQHLQREHMKKLQPRFQSIVPTNLDDEWVEMILQCPWKPMDISAEQCFRESWDSSPENVFEGSNYRSDTSGNLPYLKDWESEFDESQSHQVSYSADSWPVSDDMEKAKLLDKIHALFVLLIQHRYLSSGHLIKVMEYTIDELNNVLSGTDLVTCMDQSPTCICFLSAPKLRKILKFLQDISQSCGLGSYSEKSSNPLEDSVRGRNDTDIFEKIVLSNDMSFLLLDGLLHSVKSPDQMSENCVTDDEATPYSSTTVTSKCGYLTDTDGLFSWICVGPQFEEQLASWICVKDQKLNQGVEILDSLEKEFNNLDNLCSRKLDHLGYQEELQLIEELYLQEGKMKESAPDSFHRGYEWIMKKRKEELFRLANDEVSTGNRFELDALSSVLREAEDLSVNQMGYDGSYSDINSYLRDLEYFEDDSWRSKEHIRQMDICIEIVIQRQKEHLSVELSKLDAKILRIVGEMRQMEAKVGPLSSYDYRAILMPLVKSFLQVHLEDLEGKDATKKSDAIRDALLAELALDSQKRVPEAKRHAQEKVKDKKKGKDCRKAKITKTNSGDEQPALDYRTTEKLNFISSPMADSDLCLDASICGASVNSTHQEEQSRRDTELEAEERKLEETLEFQRKVEHEAKQKHLAEQYKKSMRNFPGKLDKALDIFSGDSDRDVQRHFNFIEQESWTQRNGFQDAAEGFAMPSTNGTAVNIYSTLSTAHMDKNAKYANIQDGVMPTYSRVIKNVDNQTRSVRSIDGKSRPLPSKYDNAVTRNNEERRRDHVDPSHNTFQSNMNSKTENNGANYLKVTRADDENEETFRADIEKAVQQSLDTYEAHHNNPLGTRMPPQTSTVAHHNNPLGMRMPPQTSTVAHNNGVSPYDAASKTVNKIGLVGTGLKNEVGEYNCFLNVIIQSLWHITRFKKEFSRRSTSEHFHVGDPCVVCALHSIFTALSLASNNPQKEAVAPTSLRLALSNLYPDSNFFQEAQMNDASEVLEVIFECLHRSSPSVVKVPDTEHVKSSCLGSWDCSNNFCIAHFLFGMDIFQRMNCHHCDRESRQLKYTSFFHNINASSLRTVKAMNPNSSFEELLSLVEMQHQLACDPKAGGCGKLNYFHHILSTPPHVFVTVIGWQKTRERAEDIMATLAALTTEINIGVLYRGLVPNIKHHLVSVVCYYGQHYHCFAYSRSHHQWVMYDDKTVKVIGSWDEVMKMCEIGRLQPQLLFYEAAN